MYKLFDGKKTSNEIIDELKYKIDEYKNKNIHITLAIIQVGDNPAQTIYRNSKKNTCESIGINVKEYLFDNNVKQKELEELIIKLNNDNNINGIFIEMPLPNNIDSEFITNLISYKKDVDGFTNYNIGSLNNNKPLLIPCTPNGIMHLLKKYNVDIEGKHVVVIGRSIIVGRPIATMLLNENATVTICHSKTKNLSDITKIADILIVSCNQKKFINKSYVKRNAVVIDVGIHREIVNGEKVISGDVDFDDVKDIVSYITPVPGGVGPMTVSMLINNLIKTVELYG